MAPDLVALTFGQLFAFFVVFIIRNRGFAPKRLSADELTAQIALVRSLIAKSLKRAKMPKEDVADLTQDVMLAAWEASEEDRYCPDPATPPQNALRRWLWGLVFHRVDHHLESARVQREVLTAEPPEREDATPPADGALIAEQGRLDLLDALLQVDDELRAIVIAHDLDGMTMAEIAEQRGIPTSTAYKRRTRALRALAALRTTRG